MPCPNCQQPMTQQTLEGHLGTSVTIDLCLPCQSIWFDERESLQLSPGSTLRLFKVIGDQASAPKAPLSAFCKCLRCGMRLVPVHDIQRTTRFQYQRCPAGHGRFITFFDFLREKNFIRPLTVAQVEELRRNVQTVNCSNCGASIDLATSSTCAHCGSPLSMLDMKQAAALVHQLQDATAGKTRIDPTLPLRLEQARRDVETSFSTFDQGSSWYRDVSATDLVSAGMSAIAKWMK